MFQSVIAIDENVVNKQGYKYIKIIDEYVIYKLLKDCGPICKTKGNNLIYISTISSLKCRFLYIFFGYIDPVKSLTNINLHKDLCYRDIVN